MTAGLCLDAGALLAVERGSARIRALLRQAHSAGMATHVPAGVVAQVWRGGPRQARVAQLLGAPEIRVADLDAPTARAVGELCARAEASDVIDAHVALHAKLHDLTVVTSDPRDIAAFGGGLRVVAI